MGEGLTATSRPGPRLVGDLGEGSGALQDTALSLFSRPPSSPTGPRLDELEGLSEAENYILPHSSPQNHRSTAVWISSLTVVSWRAGPTTPLTNDWAGPLTVAHRQWPVGGAHWGTNQWLSRTYRLVTGVPEQRPHSNGCLAEGCAHCILLQNILQTVKGKRQMADFLFLN